MILGHYVPKCMFQSISPVCSIKWHSKVKYILEKLYIYILKLHKSYLYIKILRNPVINLFQFTYLSTSQIYLTLETTSI